MDFTITGVNKIICYTEDFVRGFTSTVIFFFPFELHIIFGGYGFK